MAEPTANQLISYTERHQDHGVVMNPAALMNLSADVVIIQSRTIAEKDVEIRCLREMHDKVIAMKDKMIEDKDKEINRLREELARAAPSTTRIKKRTSAEALWDHVYNDLIPQSRSKERAAGYHFDN